ncbi:MAG TPA: DsrE family protein [Nitrososphaerales archaeon]|nr:DsrE family protein [Nitrososphaerales archaeon]
MKSLAIIISKPPFGMIHAAEAIRLANGAVTYGHDVSIILVNDGILVAKRGQKAEDSGWTSLSPLVEKLATSSKRAGVLADIESARQIGLGQGDFVEGVRLVQSNVISSTVIASDRTVIF